jgi:osmotically-inducible protein OsmY
LSANEIQKDIDSGAVIVRTKESVVGAPTGNSDDSVIETMVKGKLQSDKDVASSAIDVDAKNGEVTLKGSADSAEHVGRAIALALDTQGVTKVSSQIKVSGSHSSSSSDSKSSDTSAKDSK